MELSELAEEVATFYAKMLEHDYTKKDIFNKNFFEDWRKEMTDEERKKIKKLEKCNFQEMCDFFKEVTVVDFSLIFRLFKIIHLQCINKRLHFNILVV